MKILPITAALLIAGLAAAPMAEAAATKGKKPAVKTTTKTQPKKQPAKSQPKPQPKPEQKPAAEEAAPAKAETKATDIVSGEEKTDYESFIGLLDQQIKGNKPDYCLALNTALKGNNGDEFAAWEWMKKASDAGNAAAQYYISAHTLSSAICTKGSKMEAEAVALLKKSADKGYLPSQFDYAVCLGTGRGVPKDEKKSAELMQKACKSGDMLTRFKWLVYTGRLKSAEDLKRPEVKAEIDRGNHYVLFYVCPYYKGEEQWQNLEKAAKLGNSDAIYSIATYNLKVDPKTSYELLNLAIRNHNECAIYVMATMLMEPEVSQLAAINLQKDYGLGFHMLKLSHLMGNKEATLILAAIYYDGQYGIPQNRRNSYRHYKTVYETYKDMTAAAAMGLMLLKGDGVPQDIKAGKALLEAANKAGAVNAPIVLAYAHYAGLGYEQDASKAVDELLNASYTPYAYVFLAYIYTKGGVNVEPDKETAESYLRMAELDLGERAKQIYDDMIKAGKWDPHP